MVKRLMIAAGVTAVACMGLMLAACPGKIVDPPVVNLCDGKTTWVVVAPDSGAVLKVGQAYTVQWCYATDSRLTLVGIKSSKNDGRTWSANDIQGTVSLSATSNSFSWTPTLADTGTNVCFVKVYDYTNAQNSVISKPFSVKP